jgi:hypothetical protein
LRFAKRSSTRAGLLVLAFAAADWTMDHLNLDAKYRQSVSYATYEAGHMVYIDRPSADRYHADLEKFVETLRQYLLPETNPPLHYLLIRWWRFVAPDAVAVCAGCHAENDK